MYYLLVAFLVVASIFLIRQLLKTRNVNIEHPERVFHDEECAICLENKTYPVQASCGHEYCGNKLSSLLHHHSP